MKIREKVMAFIARLSPEPVCDDCVSGKLGFTRQQVASRASELAGQSGFERRIDQCTLCGAEKKVTRRV
ncbi:hypothetical protein [Sphingomonas colocasiae]|uniref:Uncharacterized protein n=1 Tax=Sphingomonas colocasiae TaxID=1848973 RepID=A0ABS7PPM2_9SPHN|nr:hypothetical protein [Sphingomonas colocasiae]MBY8823213.1 hypothetical protein [Sphingomonas colocasiae]